MLGIRWRVGKANIQWESWPVVRVSLVSRKLQAAPVPDCCLGTDSPNPQEKRG
jgi:hypothetical protein